MRSLLGTLLNKTPVPLVGRGVAMASQYGGMLSGLDVRTLLKLTRVNGTLYGTINTLTTSTAAVDWKLWRKAASGKKEDRTEVTTHPSIVLWTQPNDHFDEALYIESIQQHIELAGKGWVLVSRVGSVPVELWFASPERVRPVKDQQKFISGYIYTSPDGERVPLDVKDVYPIRVPDPSDMYEGLSPVQSLLSTIDSQRLGEEYNRNLYANNARPGGVIEAEEGMGDIEFNLFQKRWAETHQGVGNVQRVAILENGMKWIDTKFSLRDLQAAELADITPDKIREAYGFPKFMSGRVDDVNRATAEASSAAFGRWLLTQRLDRWKNLRNKTLKLYGTNVTDLEWDYEDPVPADAEAVDRERTSLSGAFTAYVGAGLDGKETALFLGLPPKLAESWEKPEPKPAPGMPGAPGEPGAGKTVPPAKKPAEKKPKSAWEELTAQLLNEADDQDDDGEPATAQEDLDWGLHGGIEPANAWDPSRHPRDRKGRFTKSGTNALSDDELTAARKVMDGFSPKKFATNAEVTDYLNGGPKLTKAQAGAVDRYTGDGFLGINRQLRAGTEDDPDIGRLRDAMRPLEDDLILTRTVGLEAFSGINMEDLVGKKVRDAAFSSTSLKATYGGGLSGVTITMAVPKGTPAVLAAKYSRNPSEREVLLGDGLEFAVSSVTKTELGGYKVSLIVLPPKDAAVATDLFRRLLNAAPDEEDDLQQVQDEWETALAAVIAAWAPVNAAQRAELTAQVANLAAAGDVAGFAALTVSTGAGAEVLAAALAALAVTAAATMAAEAAVQGVVIPAAVFAAGAFDAVAAATAGLLGAGLAAAAGREATRRWATGVDAARLAAEVGEELAGLSDSTLRAELGGALTRAQNEARLETVSPEALAEADVPQALYSASEVMDKNTCGPCAFIDGFTFPSWIDAWSAYAGGPYRNCDGRSRCRGTVVARWNPEADL